MFDIVSIDDNIFTIFTPEDMSRFETKLFFEGAKRRVNLERFTVLLLLSTIIATFGVIGDSTATVIGAMIIAPLMRPIMAITAGLVTGDMKRAGQPFLVAGVAGVIVLTWLLAEVTITRAISFEPNSQIASRIAPRSMDLYVALAAGAAGAFALSRDDVNDDQVDLVIYGSGERRRLSELGDQLDAALDQPFNMELIILPSEREKYVDLGE